MRVIEEKLYQIHAEARQGLSREETSQDPSESTARRGFLEVKEVTPSSPADNAVSDHAYSLKLYSVLVPCEPLLQMSMLQIFNCSQHF